MMKSTQYLAGEKLYGDDFTSYEIDQWYKDEEQGYYNIVVDRAKGNYQYSYHYLNKYYGFRHLPRQKEIKVLGIGSAYGDELLPIIQRTVEVTIVEPGEGFHHHQLHGVPVKYVKPEACGALPFEDEEFDVVTCFGVLHHIPNVSTVMCEIQRCLKPGGFALLREPIVSMGDWRKPRPGLTKNERGIPLNIFREIINNTGLVIKKEARCVFPLTKRAGFIVKKPVYNSLIMVLFDRLFSAMPFWKYTYHPKNKRQKLQPSAVFYVIQKPACCRV
jgi:2-polyprenyl-3-methyl-5-hydroxy-6-metoxy-1,4-benzoquinol methylase